MNRRLQLLIPLALLLLPLLLFHRALFFGEAFLPGDLLQQVQPWHSQSTDPGPNAKNPPWNVLRYDGITQFYPWRLQAAHSWRTGKIPLWNPHQFAHEGGTPLLANSQSAPFYPPNLLFALFLGDNFWYAFGLSAALHLFWLVLGMYRLLRTLDISQTASLLGTTALGLSAPVVAWLSLPTFLCVTAWLPWLLLTIHYAHNATEKRRRIAATIGAGAIGGTSILAGHLQMAFYVLLAGGFYALWMGLQTNRRTARAWGIWLAASVAAVVLALMLGAPQLLPALELSRRSHRAGGVSLETYTAYTHNALPIRNLVAFLVPDFFGHPNRGNYWNDLPLGNNYTEWAGYVGVLPLLLAVFALALPWRKSTDFTPLPPERAFFTLLLALTLLMSLGTVVNIPFFFSIPGFGQTGNPGRALILVAFSIAALSAFGWDELANEHIRESVRRRAATIAVVLPILLGAVGANFAARFAQESFPNIAFGSLLQNALPGITIAVVLIVVGAAFLLTPLGRWRYAAPLVLLLTVADLYLWGHDFNPTAPPSTIYTMTPGIVWLKKNASDDLIAFINRRWSMTAQSPTFAMMPPNGATVYGLHDMSGYDSLFPGKYKNDVRDAGNGEDPSPPENGNIVFIKRPEIAAKLGAKYIVLPPQTTVDFAGRTVYSGSDMVIVENPTGRKFVAPQEEWTASFRIGLILGVVAALITVSAALTMATANRLR